MNRRWKGSKEKKRRVGSFCYWNLREWLKFVTRKQRKWKRKNTEKRKWIKYQSMFLCAFAFAFAFFVPSISIYIYIYICMQNDDTLNLPSLLPLSLFSDPHTLLFFSPSFSLSIFIIILKNYYFYYYSSKVNRDEMGKEDNDIANIFLIFLVIIIS